MKYGSDIRSKFFDANLFNKYFYDQFSNPSKYDINIDYHNEPFSDLQFSEDNVFNLLKRTNLNKAAGPDRFDSALLKYCAKVSLGLYLFILMKFSELVNSTKLFPIQTFSYP